MQDRTDHAGVLRLLASGAAWQCTETADILEAAADHIEALTWKLATLHNGLNCVIHEEDNDPPDAANAVRIARNALAEIYAEERRLNLP